MTPFEKRTPLQRLMYLGGVVKAASGKAVEDTATGNPLTFETDLAKPLKSLVANFLPIQSSGTPSPENVLPITGWTGLNVMHGADQTDYDTYPVTWQTHGTIYGGYVDMVTGEVWATWWKYATTWGDMDIGADLGDYTRKTASIARNAYKLKNGAENSVCNITNVYLNSNSDQSTHYYISTTGWTFYLVLPTATDADTPIEFAGVMYEPVLITTLTPQQINAIKGNNTVWSDANGDCEVTYLKKG